MALLPSDCKRDSAVTRYCLKVTHNRASQAAFALLVPIKRRYVMTWFAVTMASGLKNDW